MTVECGFMSNVKIIQLKQDVYRRRVAFCILAGLSDTMKSGGVTVMAKQREYVYLQPADATAKGMMKWYSKVPGLWQWNTMNERGDPSRSNPPAPSAAAAVILATVKNVCRKLRKMWAAYFHRHS